MRNYIGKIAIILLVILLLVTLVACDTNDKNTTVNEQETVPPEENEDVTPEESEQTPEPGEEHDPGKGDDNKPTVPVVDDKTTESMFELVWATDLPEEYKFALNFPEKGYFITKYLSEEPEAIIPPTYKDEPIVGIVIPAFSDCEFLTSITLPNGIALYGNVFKNTNLSTVKYCGNLKEWCEIYDGDTSYLMQHPLVAAGGNVRLYLIENGRENEVAGDITIPDGISQIGEYSFYGLSGITGVTIPKSVKKIGRYAFDKCTNIAKVNYLGDVKDWLAVEMENEYANPLKGSLYLYGVELTEISSDDLESVSEIRGYAFCNCTSLTAVTFPASVNSIGPNAFCNCTNMATVTFPASVNIIDSNAFHNCTSITKVDYLGEIKDWCNIEFYSASANPVNGSLYINGAELTEIKSEDLYGVGAINNYTFGNCTSLTSVELPESVTSIGNYVWSGCTNLSEISITDNVTYIGDGAFNDTIWFENLPDGVIYIGKVLYCYKGDMPENTRIDIIEGTVSVSPMAFVNYDNLTVVRFPESLQSIDILSFYMCKGLQSIELLGVPTITSNGSFEPVEKIMGSIVNNKVLEEYSIDKQLMFTFIYFDFLMKTIGGNDEMQIIIDENNKRIEYRDGIFYERETKQMAYFSEAMEDDIVILDGCKNIPSIFFFGKKLTSIVIPASMESIDENIFNMCENLHTVYYCGTKEQWEDVSIGSGNENLLNATLYFYSDKDPYEDGADTDDSYWHWNEDTHTPEPWVKND